MNFYYANGYVFTKDLFTSGFSDRIKSHISVFLYSENRV